MTEYDAMEAEAQRTPSAGAGTRAPEPPVGPAGGSPAPAPGPPVRRRGVRSWSGHDRRRLRLGLGRSTSGSGGHYRGPDRRPEPPTQAPGRSVALAAALLSAVAGLALTYALTRSGADLAGDVDATVMWTLASTFATVAGAMSIVNWRVTGRARNIAYGVALLVLGVAGFGLGGLAPAFRPDLASGIGRHLRPAAEVTAVMMMMLGSRLPDVDTRLRPQPVVAVGATVAATLAALLVLLPGGTVAATLDGTLLLAWSAVATDQLRHGLRRERWLDTWMGLTALGMALASGIALLSRGAGHPPGPAYLTMAVLASLYAVIAVQQELSLALQRAREQADRMADAVRAGEEIRRRERKEREERDHDLRSALFALEAAARALRGDQHTADPVDGGLAAAIASELGRVKAMVASAGHGEQAFAVADAVLPIISLELARGADLRAELPERLEATGSAVATAEIVRNLLDNARRYAPNRPVRVTAERAGDAVLVRVADGGPGVRPEDRGRLFERGWRGRYGESPDGSGLGLFVSARLASEQGGTLTLDESAAEGACFVLSLPTAPGNPADAGATGGTTPAPQGATPAPSGTTALPGGTAPAAREAAPGERPAPPPREIDRMADPGPPRGVGAPA